MAATPAREIVAFARDLVAIPTENPPGAGYDECVRRICAELDSLAIDYELVETGDDEASRQVILATVGDRGPLLYLHGHYDVVPAFTPGQFEPRVEDGRLVGRGASDMDIAGPAFQRFADLLTLSSIAVFGEPSDKALKQLQDKAQLLGRGTVSVHRPHAGFTRA